MSLLAAETLLCQQRSVDSKLWFFQYSCMDVRVGLQRKLSAEESMLLNCGVGKDSEAGRDWGQEEKGMTEDEMAG